MTKLASAVIEAAGKDPFGPNEACARRVISVLADNLSDGACIAALQARYGNGFKPSSLMIDRTRRSIAAALKHEAGE